MFYCCYVPLLFGVPYCTENEGDRQKDRQKDRQIEKGRQTKKEQERKKEKTRLTSCESKIEK